MRKYTGAAFDSACVLGNSSPAFLLSLCHTTLIYFLQSKKSYFKIVCH